MSIDKESIGKDLLSLEINTILCEGISSIKMPPPREVVKEIARDYLLFLKRMTPGTKTALKEAGSELWKRIEKKDADVLEKAEDGPLIESILTWTDSLIRVRDQSREQGLSLDPETSNVLYRMKTNCNTLMDILKRAPDFDFTPEALIKVRKIWEVGTDRVLMQTVVQLDGDIITRLQVGRETQKDRWLHEIHKDTVNLGMANWQFMVNTLASLVKSIFKMF